MKATINKTNHSEHTGGKHGGRCYYNGKSIVWQVLVPDYDFPLCGFRQKWAAQALADWLNETGHDYTVGDPVMAWITADESEAAKKARSIDLREV